METIISDILDYLQSIFELLTIPISLRLYIWFQGLRFYGIITLYRNRENIYKHKLYSLLDSLYTDEELFSIISDSVRREIFRDVFRAAIYSLNETMLGIRDIVYSQKNFFGFVKYHKYLDTAELINIFLRLYNRHRDKVGLSISKKLRRGGLTREQSDYIVNKYYEFTMEYSFLLRSHLESIKDRKNIYFSFVDILENVFVKITAEKAYLPIKFSTLNGKLDSVRYKDNLAKIETKHNLEVVHESD